MGMLITRNETHHSVTADREGNVVHRHEVAIAEISPAEVSFADIVKSVQFERDDESPGDFFAALDIGGGYTSEAVGKAGEEDVVSFKLACDVADQLEEDGVTVTVVPAEAGV